MRNHGPSSLVSEHEGLLETLEYAKSRRGPVGETAGALQAALSIHMDREESVLAVLASLEDLAAGHWPGNPEVLLEKADVVERDLKRMHKEHDLIATLLVQLRHAAEEEHEEEVERFCDDLSRHAAIEEQVLYPAALIVGRYVRLREEKTQDERQRLR
jgi:iron-sulfur cluster repair protein YtfE (RIC family)